MTLEHFMFSVLSFLSLLISELYREKCYKQHYAQWKVEFNFTESLNIMNCTQIRYNSKNINILQNKNETGIMT